MKSVYETGKSFTDFWSKWDVIDLIEDYNKEGDGFIVRDNCTMTLYIMFTSTWNGELTVKSLKKKWGNPPKKWTNHKSNSNTPILRGHFSDIAIEQGGNNAWRTEPKCHIARGNTDWNVQASEDALLALCLEVLGYPFSEEPSFSIDGTDLEITKVKFEKFGFTFMCDNEVFATTTFDSDVDPAYTIEITHSEWKLDRYYRVTFPNGEMNIEKNIPIEESLIAIDKYIKWYNSEEKELEKRVGSKFAQRIVAFRKRFGDFSHSNDLLLIKGVGIKTLESWL